MADSSHEQVSAAMMWPSSQIPIHSRVADKAARLDKPTLICPHMSGTIPVPVAKSILQSASDPGGINMVSHACITACLGDSCVYFEADNPYDFCGLRAGDKEQISLLKEQNKLMRILLERLPARNE